MEKDPSTKRLENISTILQANLGARWRTLLIVYLVFFILFMTILYFALVKTNFSVQLTDENSRKVFLFSLTLFNIIVFIIFISTLTKLNEMYKNVAYSKDSNSVKSIKTSLISGSGIIILSLICFMVYYYYKQFKR
jgi:hypothetical protein